MKRSNSVEKLISMMGPSQLQQLSNRKDAGVRTIGEQTFIFIGVLVLGISIVCTTVDETETIELIDTIKDVATFQRVPVSAQDIPAAIVAILLSIPLLGMFDYGFCRTVCPNSGSRWFLLHGVANILVSIGSVQDFYWISKNPPAALSVEYCKTLPLPACSDWPACVVVALHLYHVIVFALNEQDLFHHILFVPIIGGIRFVYPWGLAGNVLCFFICGLPGALDYMMLAAVKAGKMDKFVEKRINCSINTWLRGPGITGFCTLTLMCWCKPYPDIPEEDIMPAWLFFACGVVVFFNGQHYAQRVIGDYYIRKRENYTRRGIKKVDLHAS